MVWYQVESYYATKFTSPAPQVTVKNSLPEIHVDVSVEIIAALISCLYSEPHLQLSSQSPYSVFPSRGGSSDLLEQATDHSHLQGPYGCYGGCYDCRS